jgi:hypothetical protein
VYAEEILLSAESLLRLCGPTLYFGDILTIQKDRQPQNLHIRSYFEQNGKIYSYRLNVNMTSIHIVCTVPTQNKENTDRRHGRDPQKSAQHSQYVTVRLGDERLSLTLTSGLRDLGSSNSAS